jgi:hypothetical protein
MPREPRLVKKTAALLTGKMIPQEKCPGTAARLRHFQRRMFLFFSRRLGCAGSLIISLGLSLLLLYLFGWL